MKRPTFRRAILLFVFALSPLAAIPRTRAAPPSEAGWTSSWLTPHSDEERQGQEYQRRLTIAKKTGDYKPLLPLADGFVRQHPSDAGAIALRGAVRSACKMWEGAAADFNRAIQLADRRHNDRAMGTILFFRAVCYYAEKNYDACASDLSASIKINPRLSVAVLLLARVRACCPDAAVRDGRSAVDLSRRAASLIGRQNPAVLDTLACAYAEAGNCPDAVRTQQQVVQLAQKDTHWSAVERQGAVNRLVMFGRHQPFRAVEIKTAG